jgi:hypothetical protein
VQLAIIDKIRKTHYYHIIKCVKNPPEELCKEAIDQNYLNIKYIHNPSEEICMYAIEKNYRALKYIKNKSDALCIRAMELNPKAKEYIEPNHNYFTSNTKLNPPPSNINYYIEAFNKSPMKLWQHT